MQKLIACSVCFILAGSLMAEVGNGAAGKKKATGAQAVQLVLELSDGSHIIGTPAIDRFKVTTKNADVEVPWARMLTIEFIGTHHVAKVSLQNGDSMSGQLVAKKIAVETESGQIAATVTQVRRIHILSGYIGAAYVNSMGMEFVTVPGTKVLFSIWDTRVQDYRAYAKANRGVDASWKHFGVEEFGEKFKQGDDHPVVNVDWWDAKAFCKWLTKKERKVGKIRQDQEYRLPTDNEWSAAAGRSKFPWGGDEFPPPKGAGNYDPSVKVDDYEFTSPVGSFKANQYGLYDMGGNVWQWCADWYRNERKEKAGFIRGASWEDDDEGDQLSSARHRVTLDERNYDCGFRCVLASVLASR